MSQAELEDLREAENETMLTDAEYLKVLIGEVFVAVPKDDAEAIVQKLKDAKVEEIDSYEVFILPIYATVVSFHSVSFFELFLCALYYVMMISFHSVFFIIAMSLFLAVRVI